MTLLVAVLAGVGVHAALGLFERALPQVGAGLDPFLRMVPAALAGWWIARRRPPSPASLLLGAWTGGLTGFLGVLASWALGAPPTPLLPALVSVTGTSLLVASLAAGFTSRGQSKRV